MRPLTFVLFAILSLFLLYFDGFMSWPWDSSSTTGNTHPLLVYQNKTPTKSVIDGLPGWIYSKITWPFVMAYRASDRIVGMVFTCIHLIFMFFGCIFVWGMPINAFFSFIIFRSEWPFLRIYFLLGEIVFSAAMVFCYYEDVFSSYSLYLPASLLFDFLSERTKNRKPALYRSICRSRKSFLETWIYCCEKARLVSSVGLLLLIVYTILIRFKHKSSSIQKIIENVFGKKVSGFLYSILDSILLFLRTHTPTVISSNRDGIIDADEAGHPHSLEESTSINISLPVMPQRLDANITTISTTKNTNQIQKTMSVSPDDTVQASNPSTSYPLTWPQMLIKLGLSEKDIAQNAPQEQPLVPKIESSSSSISPIRTALVGILLVTYLIL